MKCCCFSNLSIVACCALWIADTMFLIYCLVMFYMLWILYDGMGANNCIWDIILDSDTVSKGDKSWIAFDQFWSRTYSFLFFWVQLSCGEGPGIFSVVLDTTCQQQSIFVSFYLGYYNTGSMKDCMDGILNWDF